MSDGEIDWGLRNLPGVALSSAPLMEVGEWSLPGSNFGEERGKAIVMASRDSKARRFDDHVYSLTDGRIVDVMG